MKLEQIEIPVTNQLLEDFWSANGKLSPFYEYEYNDNAFQTRLNYLKSKQFNYKELSRIIRQFMEPLGISDKIEKNLQALANGSVAIVGGQQAGILTGPLYSVHKAITVILLAKEQSIKLGEEIVPVFWIAGEDHDLDEINHTYTILEGKLKKRVYKQKSMKKTMASATELEKDSLRNIIDTVFYDFGETEYTNDLYKRCLNQLENSQTFTDFFARLFNDLFKNEGLLMIDAAYEPFRQYESTFFAKIIHKNELISKVVVEKENDFEKAGYGTPIQASLNNSNLFYVHEGERYLLERSDGHFKDASGKFNFTKEQLLEVAQVNPEKLSNNVVTRPLMQEMTIPVLAFVGGPGELAYWGTLKEAFHVLDLEMPILAPRLTITLIESKVEQLLSKYQLTLQDVIKGEVSKLKECYMEKIQDDESKAKIEEISEFVKQQYAHLETYLTGKNLELNSTIEKNLKYHARQFDYLNKKIEQQIYQKHGFALGQFDLLNVALYPNGTLQERIFNPYQFMNRYGQTLIQELCSMPMTISPRHNVIHL